MYMSGANRASAPKDPVTAICIHSLVQVYVIYTPCHHLYVQVTAIPRGTLLAICFSYFMYMSFFVLWAAVGSREYLTLDHGQVWNRADAGSLFISIYTHMHCVGRSTPSSTPR